jgi:methylenetetrahydrofolate dehydrogenase (NADP+)/methenyltetrahydrofolate cyclohydrolase
VYELLKYYNIGIEGKRVVVVGKSSLVGKPIVHVLLNEGATVTVCHKKTPVLQDETLRADILVVAAGAPGLITRHHITEGVVVVDVGISVVENDGAKKIYGDVCFDEVMPYASAISPVPGGVGPMTVGCLFKNLFDAYDMLHVKTRT